MVEWLIPISLYWVIASVFFGGMYDAENGSGGQQLLGLLLCFVVYLLLFWVLRLALGGFMGPLGRVILPVAIPTMFLGRYGQIVFKLVGVNMKRVIFGADAH
ncbi:MAG: hypothetical protein MJB57_02225 [Gemmatimonadetes bacterium]|nr:hypothetical protein [Gemmatimonadota bacterium]